MIRASIPETSIEVVGLLTTAGPKQMKGGREPLFASIPVAGFKASAHASLVIPSVAEGSAVSSSATALTRKPRAYPRFCFLLDRHAE